MIAKILCRLFAAREDLPRSVPPRAMSSAYNGDFAEPSASRYSGFAEKSAAASRREASAERIFLDLVSTTPIPASPTTFALLPPSHHLTVACFKSFKAFVARHDGWAVRRRAATPEEKAEHGEKRKGAVYFVTATLEPRRAAGKRAREETDVAPVKAVKAMKAAPAAKAMTAAPPAQAPPMQAYATPYGRTMAPPPVRDGSWAAEQGYAPAAQRGEAGSWYVGDGAQGGAPPSVVVGAQQQGHGAALARHSLLTAAEAQWQAEAHAQAQASAYALAQAQQQVRSYRPASAQHLVRSHRPASTYAPLAALPVMSSIPWMGGAVPRM